MIIVRPVGEYWEVWEDDQVRPRFHKRRAAIDYAIARGSNGARRLEVRDAAGKVIRAIEGDALRALAGQRSLE